MTVKLISLCGAPGSGKTTIARKLSEHFGAKLIEEDYAGNPFLAEAYGGCEEFRLPGQAWFLLSRVNQLSGRRLGGKGLIISDYAYIQDRIYAELLMGGEKFAAYTALADQMETLVIKPSVIVLLDGSAELLQKRVAARGRDYESVFDAGFLQSLADLCRRKVTAQDCSVINVDIDRRDLFSAGDFNWLCERISDSLNI